MDICYKVNVGLRFQRSDARAIREMARLWTHDTDEQSDLHRAANTAEQGELLVFQCMKVDELQTFLSVFPRAGIRMPEVQELRLESTERGLKLRV